MSLIFPIVITVVGFIGAFFNVEMLLTLHKNKANCVFLQKCSKLVICQFCIQVTMLAIISAEAWYSFQYQRHIGEDFIWIMILETFVHVSLMFYSTTFFILAHEHVKKSSSCKLLTSAACLELINGAIHYTALCYQEVIFILLPWNIIATCLADVLVVLFAKPTKYSELQNESSSNGRESLCRRMIKGPGKSFIILFLIYLGIAVPVMVLIAWRKAWVEAFFCLNLLLYSFVFGIALPMAFRDSFNLGCGQGLKEIFRVAII